MAIIGKNNGRLNIQTKAGNNNGADANSARIPMFHGNVSPVFIAAKRPITGFILPGFDESLDPADEARKTSICPYRSDVEDENGHPEFTSWRTWVEGYNYYGKGLNSFISPKTVGNADPLEELHWFFWRKSQKDNLKEFTQYWQKPLDDKYYKVPAPLPGKLMLLNAVCAPSYEKEQDQSVKVRPLVLKKGAGDLLESDLNTRVATNFADPEWDGYVIGDITNPKCCKRFSQAERTMGTVRGQGLVFFREEPLGRGKVKHAWQDVAEAEVLQWLPYRYDFGSADTLYIPTYDEIVNLLWHEDLIPHEFIEEVCKDKCANWSAIIEGDKNALVTALSEMGEHGTPEEDEDDIPGISDAPVYTPPTHTPAPAPMPAPAPTPAPAPVAAPVMYWISAPEGVLSITETDLRNRVAAGQLYPVMKNGDTVWKTAADYGVMSPAPAAPAPAAPMPAPAPAPAPATAVSPMAAMPPAADSDSRSKIEEDRYAMLMNKLSTEPDKITDSEIAEYSMLQNKKPYMG